MNSSHTFIAGGESNDGWLSDAYLYDWATESWTELPGFSYHLADAGCTFYQDDLGESFVLVAGDVHFSCFETARSL